MAKGKIKKDQMVVVISGGDAGSRGKVLSVDTVKNRVTVEGVNVRKKAMKRSQERPEGGIVDQECPIHTSNVMDAERYDARQATKGEVKSDD